MNVSVIIITLNRPDCVRRCLACLESQAPRSDQVIVVDSSTDDRTKRAVAEFESAQYLHNALGMGQQTASRNMGLKVATGDVIAFLDDDAFPREGWLAATVAPYEDPGVGGVGGRVLNGRAGEERDGVDRIGRMTPNGEMVGNFAADPGRIIEVDHLMGANMSFRREAIASVGGFRHGFPGISGFREESEISLCVTRLGYRLLFNPASCVDHLGAPQAYGRRFGLRYAFYAERNHYVLLIRNYGLFHSIVVRYALTASTRTMKDVGRRILGALGRLVVAFAGTVVGVTLGIAYLIRWRRDPVRRDRIGREVTEHLASQKPSDEPVRDPVCEPVTHA